MTATEPRTGPPSSRSGPRDGAGGSRPPTANWAGNVVFAARDVRRPPSVSALRRLVAESRRCRAVGGAYSFSRVADTPGTLIALDRLPPVADVDTRRRTVRVSAGMSFTDLNPRLHRYGLALPNLASLPHVSVAGACATGTHGSGNGNGCIASGVVETEIVTADGSLVTVPAGAPEAGAAALSVGALGVVTHVTLGLVPAFDVEQYVWEGLSWEALVAHFTEITGAAYSVSVFTDWGRSNSVWIKRRTDDPRPDLAWTGAVPASRDRHPLAGLSPRDCTEQCGRPGPSHQRLPHFRPGALPDHGDELQSEYFVPLTRAKQALEAVGSLRAELRPVLRLSELRTLAGDDCWIGPGHGRAGLAVHFTWRNDPQGVARVLPEVERVLAPYDARPHWGKLFRTDPEVLARSYPRWADFVELRDRWDPAGTFDNDFTDRCFPRGGPQAG
ncbi:FAD-binding protein [Streptomyces sp. NPDC057939]|uniref:FAD-binding protein n=1 Tax=Streptomyces sp. NPDC057939 TaxID=3346284 RepID=UPI0036E0F5D2